MSQQTINVGSAPNDGLGDPLRTAFQKTNANFTELYGQAIPSSANPTATAGAAAINGVATTFMRSDAAPAVAKGTAATYGIVRVDGATILSSAGDISVPTGSAVVKGVLQVDGTTITASSGVISAVASGVTSFNARTGVVTLTSGDVTGALTYTPTSVTGLTGTQSVAAFKTGLTLVKADVGLGNVDNTSDANKPVSTATQTALNLKADLASPTLSGTPLTPTAAPGTNTTQIASTAFVTAAVAGGVAGVASFNARTGVVTLTSGDVTGALTYTPKDAAAVEGVATGGTNIASYAIGDLIQASASTTLAKLAAVATGNVLLSGGVTTVSSWGKVGLTTHVSGTLPVANGGTGITSLGTGVATALGINVGAAGAFVAFNGALGTPSSGSLTSCTGLPISTGLTGAGTGVLTALGVAVNGSGAISLTTSPAFVTPNLGTPSAGTLSACTVDGTNAVGFREIPQNSQSTAYTAVLADNGKHLFHPTADNNARTFTIPANSSVAYPVGACLTFANMINTVTIAVNTDTLILAGAGTTGSRTLAANGVATAMKVTTTSWLISGSGLA